MADELKSCPFCGYGAYIRTVYIACGVYPFETQRVYEYMIHCKKCNAEMRGKSRKRLIASWNRRVNEVSE